MKLPGVSSPWTVCAILLLATLLNYMDRQTLAVTLPTLKQEYNLAEGRIGMVEGCFGFAFAAGSVLFGWVADRVGPRRLYPVVLAGWSLAGIATAGAGQPWIVAWLETTGEPAGTGWETPAKLGAPSVRVEVFCDDPDAFIARAVAAGANGSLDRVRNHQMPWGTHRQGSFVDPFGHKWLVGDRSPLSRHA